MQRKENIGDMKAKKTIECIFIAAVGLFFSLAGCASTEKAANVPQPQKQVQEPPVVKRSLGPEREPNSYFYYTEAQLAASKGDVDAAAGFMEKALEHDPGSIFLEKELLNIYLRKKDNEKAFELTGEILGKNTRRPEDIDLVRPPRPVARQDRRGCLRL